MPEKLSAVLVFAQGVASFLSPCVLPLIPAYLAMLGGAPPSEILENPRARRRLVLNSVAFILGFTVVFIIMGAAATALTLRAGLRPSLRNGVSIFFGFVIVLFGLVTMGVLHVPLLERERRFDMGGVKGAGLVRPFLTGVAFSFGWTPCVGPVLASVLLLASGTKTVWAGVGLLAVYSLGMGLPFLLIALFLGALRGPLQALKKHALWIKRISGAVLVVMGIMMMTGTFTTLAALGAPPVASADGADAAREPSITPTAAANSSNSSNSSNASAAQTPAVDSQTPDAAPPAGKTSLTKARADEIAEYLENVPLPEIELPDLDGKPRAVSDFTGVRVLNVLASWCPPCRAELPILQKVTSEMGVPLIGLDTFENDPPEKVKAALNALLSGLAEPFPILMDETHEWGAALTPGSIPTTLILDAKGVVRFYRVGAFQDEEDLRELLDYMLYWLPA